MNSPLLDHLKTTYGDAQILVLGMGREGLSTAKLLLEQGIGARIAVADQKPLDSLAPETQELMQKYEISGYWGESWLDELSAFDVIFRSPGVSPFNPDFQSRLTHQQTVTSQTNEFLALFGSQTIGITGTKGKSTTSSLIYTALKLIHPDTILLGNIGKPAFESIAQITPDTKIVYELSSHQLLDVVVSPHQAVILNLYREHFDYYPSFDVYAGAKVNIVAFQKAHDIAYLADDARVLSYFSGEGSGTKVLFGGETRALSAEAKTWLTNHPGINELSVHALLSIAQSENIPEAQLFESLADFIGLPHRFEQIGIFAGRECINDSLATIPEATIAAITACGEKSGCLLVGGFNRGQTFETLVPHIADSNFHTIIGMPETGWALLESLGHMSQKNTIKVNNLAEAVQQAFSATKPGEVILLSPAAASFNAFADYAQRGDAFKTLVKEMSAP